MGSNRRFALHVDTTGYKGGIDHQIVVKIQAVTFGAGIKQEEYSQEFLVTTGKDQYTYQFTAELAAKFVDFTRDSKGYSDAPWKIHILNNQLRAVNLPPLPKLTYTYELFKELHPEKRKDHKQGQHPIEMIEPSYPVGELQGAYKIAAVQLKMEAEKEEKLDNAPLIAARKRLNLFKPKVVVPNEIVVSRPENRL